MGVKYSRVVSLELDTISAEAVKKLDEVGNAKYNSVYERYIPVWHCKPQGKNASYECREQWIRAKYEYREFVIMKQHDEVQLISLHFSLKRYSF